MEEDQSSEIPEIESPETYQEEPIVEEFTFESLDDIDVSSMPESVQTYVQPILQHVQQLNQQLDAERRAYEETRDQFSTMIEGLDAAAKGDIEPLIEEYETVQGAFTQISTENVNLAHRLFELEYPEYEQQSDEVKNAFAEALVNPAFNDRYIGGNLYDKMVDAYKLTMYRMGGKAATPTQRKVETAQPEPKQVNPNAVKQSLVSGGNLAPNLPTLNLEEMSYEDILSRGEHLLDI